MLVMFGGVPARSTLMNSSSPSPSPVRLSPVCSIEPSGERRLLKNTKWESERTFLLSPQAIALASRSKSLPVVVRTSQPTPTATAVRLGACFVNETLLPLLRLTLIQQQPSTRYGTSRTDHLQTQKPGQR